MLRDLGQKNVTAQLFIMIFPISLGHSVSYWGCLTLRNLDARGPSQERARRPGRRPAGHSSAGLYGIGLPDRTECPVWFRPSASGRS